MCFVLFHDIDQDIKGAEDAGGATTWGRVTFEIKRTAALKQQAPCWPITTYARESASQIDQIIKARFAELGASRLRPRADHQPRIRRPPERAAAAKRTDFAGIWQLRYRCARWRVCTVEPPNLWKFRFGDSASFSQDGRPRSHMRKHRSLEHGHGVCVLQRRR